MSEIIDTHIQAAKLLSRIKDNIPKFINSKKLVNEQDVRKFIQKRFKEFGLTTDKDCPIVAFGPNTSFVHYLPRKKYARLKPESLILVDMWARLKGGCYADITWMYYYGKTIPLKIKKVFNEVIKARDSGIDYIRKSLKSKIKIQSNLIDASIRDSLNEGKLGSYYLHSSGHSMTKKKIHGLKNNKGLSPKNFKSLDFNLPYTIEPGIYLAHLEKPFGIRSEIDFYIKENKIIITSDIQKGITLI